MKNFEQLLEQGLKDRDVIICTDKQFNEKTKSVNGVYQACFLRPGGWRIATRQKNGLFFWSKIDSSLKFEKAEKLNIEPFYLLHP